MSAFSATSPAEHLDGVAEQVLPKLTRDAVLAAPYELAELIDQAAQDLGASRGVAYLSDVQQQFLVPFVRPDGPGDDSQLTPLDVDSTLAGRAFQTFTPQSQDAGLEGTRVWLPLVVGADRLGVLGVTLPDDMAPPAAETDSPLMRLALLAAELMTAKSVYGDALVRLRRRNEMGLAAEMQWSLLPPLTFATSTVTVAAALEPAYLVAGDTIDYAVDDDYTRVAIFDVMGHGLHSAQCAVLAVAAYRNARRSSASLSDTMRILDEAVIAGLGGDMFATAVLAQLDTASGLLEWANAGHPPPLLLRGGKLIKALELEPGSPLGLSEVCGGSSISVGREQLEPGDRILLYTDGVIEARSPNGEFFGIDRLADLILRHLAGGLAAPETMRRVVRELLDHHQDQLNDDASLLLLEWRTADRP